MPFHSGDCRERAVCRSLSCQYEFITGSRHCNFVASYFYCTSRPQPVLTHRTGGKRLILEWSAYAAAVSFFSSKHPWFITILTSAEFDRRLRDAGIARAGCERATRSKRARFEVTGVPFMATTVHEPPKIEPRPRTVVASATLCPAMETGEWSRLSWWCMPHLHARCSR